MEHVFFIRNLEIGAFLKVLLDESQNTWVLGSFC